MIYGYRVVGKEEVGLYPAGLIQISVYKGLREGIVHMLKAVSACRTLNLRYVIHPVGYFLSETRGDQRAKTMEVMRKIARNVDLALIVHDETTPWGTRLEGIYEKAYREALLEISEICPVSIENANNTHDIEWFWKRFPISVTLDIGHVEAAGIDSVRFIRELEADIINRLSFVHLHRYNGPHDGGLRDHWGLLEDCRELKALGHLLKRKKDIGVILEINDMENLGESLKLLERLEKEKT
jgi:sugar phosphate isomerase/epimerase